ncbi:MAG: hypothetical protein LLG00_11370 [Planctomycetaceae bacterium]|nr:hypothetical protein [Planctomycetaceae bacterium]
MRLPSGGTTQAMRVRKAMSAEELQVIGQFEALRKILLSPGYGGHLDKPLCYWALPADRRLPLALMGRTLADLLDVPFPELAATPGIGRKKVASLVQLLARAASTNAAELPTVILNRSCVQGPSDSDEGSGDGSPFDPTNISEVTWAQWRESVVRHGLTGETLGRLAPSLQGMTRVIWSTPLGEYTSSTLAEIRSMRTHGEKRVTAILEVFRAAHTLVAGMGVCDHLAIRIMPRRIDAVERWVGRAVQRADTPSKEEITTCFVEPLLDQIRNDASQQVAALAENRLGMAGPVTSVRQAARLMGLTRARVYQLLNEINDIMMVRWPTGRHQVHELQEKFRGRAVANSAGDGDDASDLQQFYASVELYYPGNRRGADGPMERAFEPEGQFGELLEAMS